MNNNAMKHEFQGRSVESDYFRYYMLSCYRIYNINHFEVFSQYWASSYGSLHRSNADDFINNIVCN